MSAKALDDAVQTRPLALALSGGGGTSFVFVGAFAALEEAGIVPSVMAGTSMGSLLGAYRAKNIKFDLDDLEKTILPLNWEKVAKPLHLASRFGVPATFKLYLREVFGENFSIDGRYMRMSDLAIPFLSVISGIAHIEGQPDPDFESYEHLLDDIEPKVSSLRSKQKNIMRAVLDLASKPLKAIYIGKDDLTKEFDVIDAAGFSAAIPGLFHYDIDKDNKRMIELTSKMLRENGVIRIFDGGFVDNLPAKEAKAAVQAGFAQGRDPFVLALDGFAPSLHAHWLFLPIMKMAADRSKEGHETAHLTITYKYVLSPLNIFPTETGLKRVTSNGFKETLPHVAFIKKMLGPIPLPAGIVTELD